MCVRGVNGCQVISPQAHEGRGEETAGALFSAQGRGRRRRAGLVDLLPEWQTAHARGVDAIVAREVKNVHQGCQMAR